MPFHVAASSDPSYVEATFSGVLLPAELQQAARDALALARERGAVRFLSDCSDLVGGHSVFDLYALADWLMADQRGSRMREAVVLPSSSAVSEQVRFWETTCRNRGLDVKVFHDRGAALTWLCALA